MADEKKQDQAPKQETKSEAKQSELPKQEVKQKQSDKNKAFYCLAEGNPYRLVHPYQGVTFTPDKIVEAEEDTWLKAQMKAGLIVKVES